MLSLLLDMFIFFCKFFVYDVEDAVKVRTGARGYDALQGTDDWSSLPIAALPLHGGKAAFLYKRTKSER